MGQRLVKIFVVLNACENHVVSVLLYLRQSQVIHGLPLTIMLPHDLLQVPRALHRLLHRFPAQVFIVD